MSVKKEMDEEDSDLEVDKVARLQMIDMNRSQIMDLFVNKNRHRNHNVIQRPKDLQDLLRDKNDEKDKWDGYKFHREKQIYNTQKICRCLTIAARDANAFA